VDLQAYNSKEGLGEPWPSPHAVQGQSPDASPKSGGTLDLMSEVGDSPRIRFSPLDEYKKGTPEYIAEKRLMIDLSEDSPLSRTRTMDGRPGYSLNFQDDHLHMRSKVHDSDEITPPLSPTSAHQGSPTKSSADVTSHSLDFAGSRTESGTGPGPGKNSGVGKSIAIGVGGLVAGAGLGMMVSGGGESEGGSGKT
jgi:hypothetical protein